MSAPLVPPPDSQEGWLRLAVAIHGIGVFASRGTVEPGKLIPAGTPLNLFPRGLRSRILPADQVPAELQQHGIATADGFLMHYPNNTDFGWRLNHSTHPTVFFDPLVHPELFVAACDLIDGMELTIDYAYLREPAEYQKPYYIANRDVPVSALPQYDLSFVRSAEV